MKTFIISVGFFLFVTVFFPGNQAQNVNPEKLRIIDSVVSNLFMPYNSVPGMALAVTFEGETIISKGYGKMDVDKGIDATSDTLFSIASISKSFIATLAVKTLSEKFPALGEKVLDVPIVSLAPTFNLTFSDRFRAEQTSFRDLLAHRTCLVDPGTEILFGSMRSIQEFSYRMRYQAQACGHRSGGFHYNNALYALAGELVANVAGESLENLVRAFMIEIGMQNSTTIDSSGSYENLPNMSRGYYKKDGQIQNFNLKLLRRIGTGIGAGGILSTSNDMAKYMQFHLNKGKVGDKQVVPEEVLSWMYKPSIVLAALPGKQSETDPVSGIYAYGLGLTVGFHEDYATIGHTGYWPPFESELVLYPAKQLGVFLITNGPGAVIDPRMSQAYICAAVFDIITGSGLNWNAKNPPAPQHIFDFENRALGNLKNRVSNRSGIPAFRSLTKIEFDDVVGVYGEKLAGDAMIGLDAEDNKFLEVYFSEYAIGRLVPVSGSETKFLIEWKTDILHDFYTYPSEVFPVPVFHVDFGVKEFYLIADGEISVVYTKDATLDTLPVIPWDPESCGPNPIRK